MASTTVHQRGSKTEELSFLCAQSAPLPAPVRADLKTQLRCFFLFFGEMEKTQQKGTVGANRTNWSGEKKGGWGKRREDKGRKRRRRRENAATNKWEQPSFNEVDGATLQGLRECNEEPPRWLPVRRDRVGLVRRRGCSDTRNVFLIISL